MTSLNVFCSLELMAAEGETIATATSEAIRAYSMAVAPYFVGDEFIEVPNQFWLREFVETSRRVAELLTRRTL